MLDCVPGSCVLLVISSPGRDSRLLLPWLLLHLALIIVLVVGGTGLLCHLLINLRQVTLLFIIIISLETPRTDLSVQILHVR